jgi:hypothetical protein
VRTPAPAIALAGCIRGEPPERADWDALVALANRSWTTPRIFVSLAEAGALGAVPEEVGDYLRFVHARNLERNRRLRRQLREAVRALNAAGVVPTLLKGAVDLARERGDRLGARLVTDLDLLVPLEGGAMEAARAASRALGYRALDADRPATLFRPEDVGALELHGWPSQGRRYESLSGLEAGAIETVLGRARVRVPPAHLRILQLVIHDHVKEGDDWRGSVDLRHLDDIARMLRGDIDWRALRATPRRRRERDALEDALMMAERLFGVAVPPSPERTALQTLRHHRRLMPLRHPRLGAPIRLAGDLAWACRRVAGGGVGWPPPRDLLRALGRALRDPSRVARFLIGPTVGPKA